MCWASAVSHQTAISDHPNPSASEEALTRASGAPSEKTRSLIGQNRMSTMPMTSGRCGRQRRLMAEPRTAPTPVKPSSTPNSPALP